eukprot:TRINITY_DN6061_c0_g2_i7.p1 TRINITY_DN6061_c0_g2~~TRINITY_DN6061_c0_g2_i7.p1  ORF type:complete len:124 (+),score=16.77 TRINITY_DN6061_c0_g2_i7:80-451(+)
MSERSKKIALALEKYSEDHGTEPMTVGILRTCSKEERMKCLGALFDPVPPDLVSELFTPWEQFEIRLGAREKTFDQIKEGDIIATVNGYFKGDDLDMIDLGTSHLTVVVSYFVDHSSGGFLTG